jgi:hypothetical protein
MRSGFQPRAVAVGCALVLALGAQAAPAQDFGGCAQPRSWREIYLHPGDPRAEVAACLKDHAWDVRHLKVPLRSAAAGIVAQCEVDVTFFAGPQGSDARFRTQRELDSADSEIVADATAKVTHYRGCLGR